MKYRVDDEILFPVAECEYEGSSYPCPRQSETYLALRYGQDWRTTRMDSTHRNDFLLGKALPDSKHYCDFPDFSSSSGDENSEMVAILIEMVNIFDQIHCPQGIYCSRWNQFDSGGCRYCRALVYIHVGGIHAKENHNSF